MIRKILNSLNPFRAYFDHRIRLIETQERINYTIRAEKQEERQAFITALQATAQVSVEASKASQMQAQALSTFLSSFSTTTSPQLREWDEEADNQRYLEKHAPELVGKDKAEQWQMLMDKMDLGEI